MMKPDTQPHIGLLGMEATGLAERSIALDIAHALCLKAGFAISFHTDLAFDDSATVWRAVEQEPQLDALLVCLRPSAALLLPRLRDAIDKRSAAHLSLPIVVLGGPTALAAPGEIAATFPEALVWQGTVESGFPHFLERLRAQYPEVAHSPKLGLRNPIGHFGIPAHFSTEQCVRAGGSVWIEASRGCTSACAFCLMSHDQVPSGWVPRPVGELFDEIELIQELYGTHYFSFADLSAFETAKYTQAFLSEQQERHAAFSFRCDMRLATANRLSSQLAELRAAGLTAVYVGIESLVPQYQQLYGKPYPGRTIIDYMQSLGILVSAGFIMLDPLYSPADFRRQVVGVRNERILDLIATPFKTTRIQRGTRYEKIARKLGIVDHILPDLYTYSYRCLDPRMEIVRQLIEFFHQSTKDVYYNPYIEGQIRQAGHDDDFSRRLHRITVRYKEAQMALLDELSTIAAGNFAVDAVLSLAIASAKRFSAERKKIFAATARDYENLLENGIPYYRRDLEKFVDNHQTVPMFDPDLIEHSMIR